MINCIWEGNVLSQCIYPGSHGYGYAQQTIINCLTHGLHCYNHCSFSHCYSCLYGFSCHKRPGLPVRSIGTFTTTTSLIDHTRNTTGAFLNIGTITTKAENCMRKSARIFWRSMSIWKPPQRCISRTNHSLPRPHSCPSWVAHWICGRE